MRYDTLGVYQNPRRLELAAFSRQSGRPSRKIVPTPTLGLVPGLHPYRQVGSNPECIEFAQAMAA